MKKYIFILFITTCFSTYSQVIATDRPSAQTDNSYTLYNKAFQVESGLLYLHDNGIVQPSSLPNLLLRYGLLDKLELRFSSEMLFSLDDETIQLGPLILELNFNLLEKKTFN